MTIVKDRKVFILLAILIVLTGCSEKGFTPINHHQSFVGAVNIVEPAVSFYDPSGDKIATWKFEKAYTGAVLIQKDQILMYGHELNEADLYQLSNGKKKATIETGVGTTNAYYDKENQLFFITNSANNTVTSYDLNGKKLNQTKLGNYPMSMASHDGKLYVVNYKDTVLSVLNMKTLEVEQVWEIDKSSNGIVVVPENNSIWIGGHGEGSQPNQTVDIYDLHTGKNIGVLEAAFMPIGFAKSDHEVYIVNHGSNELVVTNLSGKVLWHIEVGANPFSVTYIRDQIVVAGYDDSKVYFIRNGKIEKEIETNKGPFQLLVREVGT